MTRSELVEALSIARGLPRRAAEEAVEIMLATMAEAMVEGGRVELRGFGSFRVREVAAYTGRNPQTGEPVDVPAKRLPAFKAGKSLHQALQRALETDLLLAEDSDE